VLRELVKLHNLKCDDDIIDKVGIITPFRSQIANIRERLEVDGFRCYDAIQVDTVERFQGSQKDFILVSLCMNRLVQMDFLAQSRVAVENKTEKGLESVIVDRKLNVTLTRARKQIILTGNEAVLGPDEIYGRLIDEIRNNGGYLQKGARWVIEG
jgi:DNA replication ATP-dependent helicase Dna2